jgi:hypothetical protein
MEKMPLEVQRTLREFYSPFNERLFELSGRRCPWWSLSS